MIHRVREPRGFVNTVDLDAQAGAQFHLILGATPAGLTRRVDMISYHNGGGLALQPDLYRKTNAGATIVSHMFSTTLAAGTTDWIYGPWYQPGTGATLTDSELYLFVFVATTVLRVTVHYVEY